MYDIIQDGLVTKLKEIFGIETVVYTQIDTVRNSLANKEGPEVESFLPYIAFWRNSTSFAWSRSGAPLNMAQVRSGVNIEFSDGKIRNIKLIACDFLYSMRVYAYREDELNNYEKIYYITKINHPYIHVRLFSDIINIPLVFSDEITKSVEEGSGMTKDSYYYFDTDFTAQGFLLVEETSMKRIQRIIKSIYDFDSKKLIEREEITKD